MFISLFLSFKMGSTALTGYTELTGGLSFGATTASGSTGRTVVNNHTYIAAVYGTGGWNANGSYSLNNVCYRAAFDSPVGDGLTGANFFDGARSGYAGVEFKSPQLVTQIAYKARSGQSLTRLNGAYFQGSDNGVNYTTLFTICDASTSAFTYKTADNGLSVTKPYKYYRLIGHSGMQELNIMELKLYTTSAFGSFGSAGYYLPPPSGPSISGLFNTVRNAAIDNNYNNVMLLTPEKESQQGLAWAKQKIDLTKPFAIETYVYLYHKQGFVTNTQNNNFRDGGLADGLTFTLQNDNEYASNNNTSGNGGLLGVYGGTPAKGYVKNALTIELDTKPQTSADTATGVVDPTNGNMAHIAVLTPKSGGWVTVADHKNVGFFAASPKWYPFNISWTPSGAGGVLKYEFNGKSYSYTVSSCASQFGGTNVYWGFSGATGWGTAIHAVAFKTLPNVKATINVVHQSTQGYELWRDVFEVEPGAYGPYNNYPFFPEHDAGLWDPTSDPRSGVIEAGQTITIRFLYGPLY